VGAFEVGDDQIGPLLFGIATPNGDGVHSGGTPSLQAGQAILEHKAVGIVDAESICGQLKTLRVGFGTLDVLGTYELPEVRPQTQPVDHVGDARSVARRDNRRPQLLCCGDDRFGGAGDHRWCGFEQAFVKAGLQFSFQGCVLQLGREASERLRHALPSDAMKLSAIHRDCGAMSLQSFGDRCFGQVLGVQ